MYTGEKRGLHEQLSVPLRGGGKSAKYFIEGVMTEGIKGRAVGKRRRKETEIVMGIGRNDRCEVCPQAATEGREKLSKSSETPYPAGLETSSNIRRIKKKNCQGPYFQGPLTRVLTISVVQLAQSLAPTSVGGQER